MAHNTTYRWFHVLCWLLLAFCMPAPTAAGWKWERPPNMVVPDCGKRNPIFYEGEQVRFTLPGTAAVRYEVRDYWGELVDQGPAGATITLNVSKPGWYKLYLYGSADQPPWGYSVGGTMFIIVRNDPRFPPLPPKAVPRSVGEWGGAYASDIPTRSVLGFGPNRWYVQDASDPDKAISLLEGNITLEQQYYLPYDPVRKRNLIIAFPNGTSDLAGVRKIVERFKNVVRYWEPRNEPQDTSTGAAFAVNEMKPFYEAVKSVDPSLRVIGPGTVSIGPSCLGWIEDFLKAGGGDYIDGFSFHAYNNVNGDVALARKSLDSLNAILAKYGCQNKEKWQTEQGYFAAVYGSYQPRLQGRWTMLQMMVYEQYGLPKEHNYYWYERSHGFWDFPTWWENEGDSANGLNPAAALMRVWAEELFGTTFKQAYDLGPLGNKLYLGSLFEGSGKRVAAFMSAGSTDGCIDLAVTGPQTLQTVSAFGVASQVRVVDGVATLPVPELPVYVELAAGQSIEPRPQDYGPNLARLPGVAVTSSGSASHPMNAAISNEIDKIINGKFEFPNWGARPWMSNVTSFPAWLQIDLPSERPVDRIIAYACPPWSWEGSLVDYELQYERDGQWITIEHVQEPLKTFQVYTPTVRCTVDSFYSDRWVFQHSFPSVTAKSFRLLVHDVTCGGGATKAVQDAGGMTGPHQIALREVELYDTSSPGVTLACNVRTQDGQAVSGAKVQLIGPGPDDVSVASTGPDGSCVFAKLLRGGRFEVTVAKSGCSFSPLRYMTIDMAADARADFTLMPEVSGSGTGLDAVYHLGAVFGAEVLHRVDPVVDFPSAWPPVPVPRTDFSVRWEGQIVPRYSEEYTFASVATGGERLWIDGRLVLGNLVQHPVGSTQGKITLVGAARHNIVYEYIRKDTPEVPIVWGVRTSLHWSSPSQPEEIIPTSRLFPARIDSSPLVMPHALAIQSSPAGASIGASPADFAAKASGSAPLSLTYNRGTSVTLTANALAGYTFQKWQVDGVDSSTSNTLTLSVDADHSVTAVYVAEAEPKLDITTSGLPDKPAPGSQITVTVTYTNPSSAGAVNASIKADIPENTTYVAGSASNSGIYDAAAKVVRWTIPNVASNASGTVSFLVTVN